MENKTQFELCQAFKKHIDTDFKQFCLDTYGPFVYRKYLKETLNQMLESFEEQLEIAGIETLREDELEYSRNIEGD